MSSRAVVMASLAAHVEDEIVRVTTNVQAKLIEATPVDTSFARSNWTPSVGAPAEGTVPIGRNLVAAAIKYRLEFGSAFLTNNAKYIQRLNNGSSTQAPSGFVEQSIARGIAAS